MSDTWLNCLDKSKNDLREAFLDSSFIDSLRQSRSSVDLRSDSAAVSKVAKDIDALLADLSASTSSKKNLCDAIAIALAHPNTLYRAAGVFLFITELDKRKAWNPGLALLPDELHLLGRLLAVDDRDTETRNDCEKWVVAWVECIAAYYSLQSTKVMK